MLLYYLTDNFMTLMILAALVVALVQADSLKNVEVVYNLSVTDFLIPPLTLEPVVENAFKYGTGTDSGQITAFPA